MADLHAGRLSAGGCLFPRGGEAALGELLGGLLWATSTPYATHFEGAQFVHFLLGPTTVSLAVPLVLNLPRRRRATAPVLAALLAGSAAAIATTPAIARAFQVNPAGPLRALGWR